MNYEEAINYLKNLTRFGINLGLERIKELLRRLGNPHLGLRTVHIGGTNGKGSTTVMLAGILREAGYRTGAFTSPHLHSYTERYRVNGVVIKRERLAELIGEIRPYLDGMVREGFEHPTEFEVGTAMAFLYFRRERVDFLLLEVGMGGAIDSTNVIIPQLAVITNVAMDHMDYLGRTLEDIARVKAGIIKPGVPLVTAAAGPSLQVLEEVCRELGAPLILVGRDVSWEHLSLSSNGQRFNVRGRRGKYENLIIPLLGRHQQVNAATALAAMEVLMDKGFNIDQKAAYQGLARVRWPGRLEVMRHEPLVLIDGAHNYEGARSLRQALADHFPAKEVVLVIGMLGDKEYARVAEELAPIARAVIVTRPDSPRANSWQELSVYAARHNPRVYLEEDNAAALRRALSLASRQDLVCVTGSLHMIADIRKLLINEKI